MLFDVQQANPEMLTLARESLGMTQTDVADAMRKAGGGTETTVSQGYVSRAEKGLLAVSGDRLELYGRALNYPPAMLCLDPRAADVGIGLVHHRKKAALSAPTLRCIHAQLALTRIQVQNLLDKAGQHPATDRFIRVAVDGLTPPAEAAATVRRAWGVPAGPVVDLVGEIEKAGGVVLLRDLGSDLLDAVSQWSNGGAPLMLVNNHAPGDRRRFSIAHELGHLVMHDQPGVGAEQEKQADTFAAAFLMPASDIRREFASGVSLTGLLALKLRWRVSMSALLRRAQSLDAITDWQYRTITIEMSALGYRTSEPGEISAEIPGRARDAIRALTEQRQLQISEIAKCMYLLPDNFRRLYQPELLTGFDFDPTT